MMRKTQHDSAEEKGAAPPVTTGAQQRDSMHESFFMVRSKRIDYLESPAVVIYFENKTQHANELRLEGQILKEKNRIESLETYTSTISHEFRTPLSTSLMFLESLLTKPGHSEGAFQMLSLVVSQLNLLLCLVNDVLDMKLIKVGKFEAKLTEFEPAKTLRFIEDMFRPQADI